MEEFNHGGTRNLAAGLARGEVLVFTSQDAVAIGEDWLATLVAPLAGERVAGVYGRQLANPEAHPPERYFLDFLYGADARAAGGRGRLRADDGDDALLERQRRHPPCGLRATSPSSTTSS